MWPKSASALTRKINGIKTNLREKGFEITLGKDEKGKRYITISKMPSILSISSKTSDLSTKSEEKFDSKSDNEQMPSNEIGKEIQAQKTTLDGIDGIDSNLQTDKEEQEIKNETPEEKYLREQEEQEIWNKGLES